LYENILYFCRQFELKTREENIDINIGLGISVFNPQKNNEKTMGARKRLAAEARKEANKNLYVARLVDNPTSPRKTRIMADVIRGKDVDYAMNVLKYSHKESAEKLLKLLKSAIANWQIKNEGVRLEDSQLYVKTIIVIVEEC
jgi:large subunit ribosomal protein L22